MLRDDDAPIALTPAELMMIAPPAGDCGQCRWWDETNPQIGMCRKLPPQSDGWPKTGDADWCGEFERAPVFEMIDRKEAAERTCLPASDEEIMMRAAGRWRYYHRPFVSRNDD